MITKKEYKKLKPYWDYQRKIQFNREEALEHSNYFDDEDSKEVFEHIWDNLSSENYDDPPEGWIPKDPKYQIEGEI